MYRATKALRDVQKKDLIPVAISPLIGGKMPMENRVVECFRILSKEYDNVPEDDLRRLQAVLYILAQKFLKQEEMGRIKEEINMTYLGQLIFNDGVEAGIKQGVEKGIEKVSCK